MASFTDNFTRANSTTLGSDWVEDSGDWAIDTNALTQTTGSSAYFKCRWNGTALDGSDNYAQCDGRSDASSVGYGAFVRGTTSGAVTYYAQMVWGNESDYLVEITAGVETLLDTGSARGTGILTLRIEANGSTLTGYVGGVASTSATDGTLTSGAVGLCAYGSLSPTATRHVDTFAGGDLTNTQSGALSSAGTGALSGTGASLAGGAHASSGIGALAAVGASLAEAVGSSSGVGVFGGVGASQFAAVLSVSGVGDAGFVSASLTAFNPVLVSRRFRRKHVRTPLDFKVKRHRAVSYPSDRIENTALTVAATSSASFVGAEGGTTFKVELVSRRFGRRKTRISEADVLFSFQRGARKWEPIYGTISIPPPFTSRRQWRKRKRVDSTPFLSRKAPRARSLLTTEPSSEYAVLSASGAGDASFVGASLFDAILSVAGTSEATFPTTVIASAALTAEGIGAAVFVSDDEALAANLNQAFFGRRRMVRQ